MSPNTNVPVYADLEGKTALVTGSSKNMGRTIAEGLGEVGVNVGITGRSDREGCEETAKAVEAAGGEAAISMGDLGDVDDVKSVVNDVREELGPIDILVNNAAIRPSKPFEEIELDEYQHVLDVNLRSAFVASQQVVPDMRERGEGTICNILGLMALQGRRTKAHGVVTKTGLIGLTKTLAAELGPHNIRVNSVIPGRKIQSTQDLENMSEEKKANLRKLAQATPMRRRGNPEEIASAVRFMVSNEASFINAEILKVDGGLNTCVDIENIDVGDI